MKMRQRNKKLLAKFLSRDLSEKEKKEFIRKTGSDSSFLKDLLRSVETNEAFESVYGAENDPEKPAPRGRKSTRFLFIFLTAAALLILALVTGLNRYRWHKDPGGMLFKQYYEPYQLTTVRSPNNLYMLYLQKDFESLSSLSADSLKKFSDDGLSYILAAVSSIETGNLEKAALLLEQVDRNDPNIAFAYWYESLLSLEKDEFNRADSLLLLLEKAGNLYTGDCNRIRDLLKRKGLVNSGADLEEGQVH